MLAVMASRQVEAHGFCTKIVIGGRPADNAHTEKADYTTAQVATGGNSLAATKYKQVTVPAKGGDRIVVHYDQWPQPHSGPIMLYMSNCGKSCDGVRGGDLDWFKIGQEGFHDGQWPNDRLLASNDWGSHFTLPTNLPSGKYLLAHHMLALHSLGDPQFYPVAFQIDLKSSGTVDPQPKGKFPDIYLNGPQDFATWNIYEAGAGNADMKLPGIAVYQGSDATVGNTGSNGAQNGVSGGQNIPKPAKPTPGPTSTRTSPTKSAYASAGRVFAQTTGTDLIKTRPTDVTQSASSEKQKGKDAPPVEDEAAEEEGTYLDDEEALDETETNLNTQTEDDEAALSHPYEYTSANIPKKGSNQRLGQPLSEAGGPVPTNVQIMATVPEKTGGTTNGGKKHVHDVAPSDDSEQVVTVTVTVYGSAPTASSAGKAEDDSANRAEQGVEEEDEEPMPEEETEDMPTLETEEEETPEDSKNASTFISDLPAQVDCDGKNQPLARSLEPRRVKYQGDLRRGQTVARYAARRHDWWL
ncbi:hypothetical protein QFC22_003303 [Naganishia vaughanmartiniae]|uniref:Uncharacterized protein n=1 Tax=Naganishia vaughanmartiniae TaxID=1424756 RepID=A0ACC2X8B9_9TREE|nr:hypothetical protein QFC22_003303 [Naganishia vaughanmartiniae]